MVLSEQSADLGKLERDQEEILRGILERVRKFSAAAVKVLAPDSKATEKKSPELSILVNGQSIFQSDGERAHKIRVTEPAAFDQLKNVINNPSNSQDNIRIKLGQETVFHVDKNGVQVDRLGLSAKPVQTKKESSLASLEEQVQQLAKIVTRQQKKIELLEKKIDFITQNASRLKNNKLKSWLSSIGNSIKSAWANIKTKVQETISSQLKKGGEQLANFNAKMLEKPVNFMLNKFGQNEGNGTISFHGERYSFQRNIESGEISIFSRSNHRAVVAKGKLTPQASPEDLKILRTLPTKVETILSKNTTQSMSRGRRR